MTRIFIVDDHKQFRRKLRSLVETHSDWVVCCEAADGLEAVEKHGSVAPHVTVMDFSMPVLDGLKASRLILVKHPDATILNGDGYSFTPTRRRSQESGNQRVLS